MKAGKTREREKKGEKMQMISWGSKYLARH